MSNFADKIKNSLINNKYVKHLNYLDSLLDDITSVFDEEYPNVSLRKDTDSIYLTNGVSKYKIFDYYYADGSMNINKSNDISTLKIQIDDNGKDAGELEKYLMLLFEREDFISIFSIYLHTLNEIYIP